MIGHVSTGKSFFHCISYCLEDKQDLTAAQKIAKSLQDGLQHTNRAEVLDYNKCFGDKYELAEQFKDVRKLSKRVEQPVLHLSVRFAPGESLDRNQLTEIGREMAKDFGVGDNQYITLFHKDTNEQHIHLVANRVGYDGKAANTSNNFLTMDRLCRRLEKKYKLKEVLSARRFLSKEQRLIPRHDIRKEKLKNDIQQTLKTVKHYDEFERQLEALGYKIIKGRGISFIDDKKVKIKGSEVGFSLATIEKVLHLKNELAIKQAQQKMRSALNTTIAWKKPEEKQLPIPGQKPLLQGSPTAYTNAQQFLQTAIKEPNPGSSTTEQIQNELSGLLGELLKPAYIQEPLDTELSKQTHKKKKKKSLRL